MRIAGVSGKEGVGPEHDRRVGLIGELGNDAVVQRRRIKKRAQPRKHWQQRPAGQAERVKHRQSIQHDVRRAEIDSRAYLEAVRLNVGMAQRNPLRSPLGAGGEKNDARLVRIAAPVREVVVKRRYATLQQAEQLVQHGDALAQIFEVNHLGAAVLDGFDDVGELGGRYEAP